MSYWDTSCLVKLYVAEPDSAQFEAHAASAGPLITSEIRAWELWTTLRRKEAAGSLAPGAARALFQTFRTDVATGELVLMPADAVCQTEFEAIVDNCHGHMAAIMGHSISVRT